MEVAGAAVITQTTPQTQYFIKRCSGQRAHVGEAFDKAREVIQHGRHLRLLQHDFGQPDPVRIACVLPWQIVSPMDLLPVHHLGGQIHHHPLSNQFRCVGHLGTNQRGRSHQIVSQLGQLGIELMQGVPLGL